MIREATPGTWCDYCKDRYGWNSQTQDWNFKAKSQAWVTVISETARAMGRKRSYCLPCANEVTIDAQGKVFTLNQQVDFARESEVIHV